MKRPIFIAEIGSNIDSFSSALLAITEAAQAGADAVKFQFFNEVELYGRGSSDRLLNGAWIPKLRQAAQDEGLMFGISAFSQEGVDLVSRHVDFYKVASAENNMVFNFPRKIPRIISTGGSGIDEIERIVKANKLGAVDGDGLLYCIPCYPADKTQYDLTNILILKQQFPYLKIGLSDHTEDEELAVNAALYGIDYVEKHFRPSSAQRTSPDWPHSVPSDIFMAMVTKIEAGDYVYSVDYGDIEFVEDHKRGFANIDGEVKVVRSRQKVYNKVQPLDSDINDSLIMKARELADGEFLTTEHFGA